jgi:hypothetical protein
MRRFALKLAVFTLLFVGAATLACHLALRVRPDWFDPRLRLLYAEDVGAHRVALLGTSAFSSHYVDREEQTVWRAVARETGLATFPGALNGARAGDMLAAARHLAARMPAGSVVFVETHPFNRWRRQEANYTTRFLIGGFLYDGAGAAERAWNVALHPLFAGLFRVRELVACFGPGPFFHRDAYRDRRWDRDGDFALRKYREILAALGSGEIPPEVDVAVLREIHDILAGRGLRPVFVLTPLNTAEIDAYSPPAEAAAVRAFADRRHDTAVAFLAAHAFPAIDLYRAVPPEGFADLIHTNASGDALLAHALALRLAAVPEREVAAR